MRLRLAIKICKNIFDYDTQMKNMPWMPRYGYSRVDKAIAACRKNKRWLHDRRCNVCPGEREMGLRAQASEAVWGMLTEVLTKTSTGVPIKSWEELIS